MWLKCYTFKKISPRHILIKLYFSHVQSSYCMGIVIGGGGATYNTILYPVKLVQEAVIRIITSTIRMELPRTLFHPTSCTSICFP